MLTPRFKTEQTEESVVLFIHAPYTDVNESEVHIEESLVCFYAAPYYLRLNLPGPVVEDDNSKGTFDVDSGDYIVTLSKRHKGQKFENLDMLNALMKPPSGKSIPSIEVLGKSESHDSSSEFSDFDWFIDQEVPDEKESVSFLPTYGFANRKSGIFKPLEAELPELLDFSSPDSTDASEREKMQSKWEDEHFSPEHFLADWAEEDEIITPLLEIPAPWQSEEKALSTEEQERLLRLPKIEILQLNQAEQKSALLGLAELLFCWAHEQIATMGDTSPESARSIRRLSSTLSWLRTYSSAKKMVLSCFRRSLCVPLYRNWKLALKAQQHAIDLIKSGKIRILKSLLSLHQMFSECEGYHVHNQLYIEPYLIWTQSVPVENFNNLAAALEKSIPAKCDLKWDLEELEAAGKITLEEERNNLDILTKQLKSGLNIKAQDDDSDDSSDSDWESSSESSSDTSSEVEESTCSNEED